MEESYCNTKRIDHDWVPRVGTSDWNERDAFKLMLAELWEYPHAEHVLTDEESVEFERSLEERFSELAGKWESETSHVSSITKRVMHPSYQTIIGMGRDVVPILLRDLQKNRRPWFWALSYITQANPIDPADAGKMDKMIAAWVNWGKERGLL